MSGVSTSTAARGLTAPSPAVAALLARLPGKVRLGTRRSALARTQSGWVADRLSSLMALYGYPVEVELVDVTTKGDVSTAPLSSLGGTGVFVSALRDALIDGRIDFAVHSLKDLPTTPADGLVLAALPPREDPRDALIARDGLTLAQLPAGATIGTGSPRRAAQLRALGFDLTVVDVRGNIDTRLKLVGDGVVDAIVLAQAGLIRIGRTAEVTEVFDSLQMLPAPGQGALAVEGRVGDLPLLAALGFLDDAATRASVLAERSLLARLEAGCAAPVGALAEVVPGDEAHELSLRAVVGSIDGRISIRRSAVTRLPDHLKPDDAASAAVALGQTLAEQMLDDGAAELIPVLPGPPGLETSAAQSTAAMAREGES